MAHPTRTGDVVAFSYPPYQFDAATPGTLVALSAFFGQHGYVPDVQDLANNINMRATFLAGGEGIGRGTVDGVRSIDLAPTIAYILGVPEPQQSQGVVRLDMLKDGNSTHAGPGDRAQRLPRPTRADDVTDRRPSHDRRRRRATGDDVRRGGGAVRPEPLRCWPRGDNVGASPANSACWKTCRRSTSRTRGVSTRRRTATTSSTTASTDCRRSRIGPTSRSSAPTSSTRRRGEPRLGAGHRTCSTTKGIKIGVIGIELEVHARARQRRQNGRLDVPPGDATRSETSPRSCASRASGCRSC